jgi:hypothetical protein
MIHTELIAASQRTDAMSKVDGGGRRLQRSEHQAYRVRLPGSSATRMWGLGDAHRARDPRDRPQALWRLHKACGCASPLAGVLRAAFYVDHGHA